MKEAARGQIIILRSPKIGEAEAIIDRAESDRLRLNWTRAEDSKIRILKEGDELLALVHTSAGVKRMNSMVINSDGKEFYIESAPAISEPQNRAFVRASIRIRVFVQSGQKLIGATTLDLGGGGMKFILDSGAKYEIGDIFEVRLLEDDFTKDINAKAQVLKVFDKNTYVVSFVEINEYDRDKIVRFCIKALS